MTTCASKTNECESPFASRSLLPSGGVEVQVRRSTDGFFTLILGDPERHSGYTIRLNAIDAKDFLSMVEAAIR